MDLQNKTVILTRPRRANARYARCLEAAGAHVVCLPVMQLQAIEVGAVPSTDSFDAMIFTSSNAVRFFHQILQQRLSREAAALYWSKPMATVGDYTARLLEKFTRNDVISPTTATGIEALQKIIPASWRQKCRRILVPTALGEGQILKQQLAADFDQIQLYPCYLNHPLPPAQIKMELCWQATANAVVFFSPSAAMSFHHALVHRQQEHYKSVWLALASGKTTMNKIIELGFSRAIQVKTLTPQGVVESLRQSMLE